MMVEDNTEDGEKCHQPLLAFVSDQKGAPNSD